MTQIEQFAILWSKGNVRLVWKIVQSYNYETVRDNTKDVNTYQEFWEECENSMWIYGEVSTTGKNPKISTIEVKWWFFVMSHTQKSVEWITETIW